MNSVFSKVAILKIWLLLPFEISLHFYTWFSLFTQQFYFFYFQAKLEDANVGGVKKIKHLKTEICVAKLRIYAIKEKLWPKWWQTLEISWKFTVSHLLQKQSSKFRVLLRFFPLSRWFGIYTCKLCEPCHVIHIYSLICRLKSSFAHSSHVILSHSSTFNMYRSSTVFLGQFLPQS